MSSSSAERSDSVGCAQADSSTAAAPAPISAETVRRQAMRPERNPAGSLSPSSSDNHAVGRPQEAAHSIARTVLPEPAGAEMRVSARSSPLFRTCTRRGRRTSVGRGVGM